MIPLVAVIRVQSLRLWIPLFLIWLLLLPFMLLLLPLVMLACLMVQLNPFRTLAVLWQILAGLRGTNIEVNDIKAAVAIRIY
jgi:hypothetical protein